MGVIVLGSANEDTAVSVRRHPGAGETVLASSAGVGAGGKGLNQAIAAARAGASTTFVGAVGDDDAGARLRLALTAEEVGTRLARSDRVTGSAFVMVSAGGENAIVVVPGANQDAEALGREADAAVGAIAEGDIVLAQLEIPIDVVLTAFRLAGARGASTVLNAAPSAPLSDALLDVVDILVVNEHECLDAAGGDRRDVRGAAEALAARVGTVIVTLGAQGALVLSGGDVDLVAAHAVSAVDTTAAGDTFCGALAARLAAGEQLNAATRFASAAAALCVQRPGASASAPYAQEIGEFLAARAS
ncbi:ribokinase [Microbacterium sp. MYb62]|uniref:ribokinase n=1 Tax=Microbacterium sp. MYb62 TaxID=1848690 RepID=UPI000CFBB53C|nr:ribokinase [Microbacterium sp. MYb62]PRB18369.1 ribokinase [Microbacterium sp. MYb62]